jgi:hypothetical protein
VQAREQSESVNLRAAFHPSSEEENFVPIKRFLDLYCHHVGHRLHVFVRRTPRLSGHQRGQDCSRRLQLCHRSLQWQGDHLVARGQKTGQTLQRSLRSSSRRPPGQRGNTHTKGTPLVASELRQPISRVVTVVDAMTVKVKVKD